MTLNKYAHFVKVPDSATSYLDCAVRLERQFLKHGLNYRKKSKIYYANTEDSRNIRKYNVTFTMTNFYSARPQERQQGWQPLFTITGQSYHQIGPMIAEENRTPTFLQIYFWIQWKIKFNDD